MLVKSGRINPRWLPLIGGALMIAAMFTGLSVTVFAMPPLALRLPVLVLALIAALVGAVLALWDLPVNR